jgi:signal transduction histidine kinase
VVDTEPVRRIIEDDNGGMTGIYPDYRGVPIVGASIDMPEYGWVLLAEVDKAEAFASIMRLRTYTIIMGFVSAIVIITIVILISKKVTRPIQKLVEGTRKIASGDLGFKIPTRSKDEIGFLATSFNEMTSQLGESKRQLEDYALNLEKKVEDKSKEIKKSSDEWLNTFNAITDIITIHDKDFRIIRANKAFYEKFNDGIVQPSDKKCYEIFHGTDESWHNCPLVRSANSLQPEYEEVDDPNMGGVFLISTYPLLNEKGEFYGVVHQAKDITFQKRVEKQLFEKAKKLKTVNKELEDFVYIVSHDLKEPLFSIGGYTSRLSRVYEDTFDEKGKHYISRIKVNIEKMSQKIQEIMEVLKVGRVTYDFKNNDTGVIVNDVVKMLENKMEKNKINILIQDNLPAVLCDERRMKDVLSNLLANAIKFMGEGEQRQVRVGCNKNGDYYKFYIEDTGIGIREEYQEQIFKVFRRLNDIETEGTGVGLAIVKKIVEQHEGKIWVESPVTDGRGTRFCFTIPILKNEENMSLKERSEDYRR